MIAQADFHADRLTGIGGSDMLDLFSMPSPYTTIPGAGGCIRRLAYQKAGIAPDFKESPETLAKYERGHKLEPLIADWYAEANGVRIRRRKLIRHKSFPWAFAHIDRQIVAPTRAKGPGVLECKSVSAGSWGKVDRQGAHDHHIVQLQHCLFVTGWRWGVLAYGLKGGTDEEPTLEAVTAIELERDEALIDKITRHGWRFWYHIEGLWPWDRLPEGDPRCKECRWRKTCGAVGVRMG